MTSTGAMRARSSGSRLRRLGDRGRAEDAVQETFASIWRSAGSYKPDRGPGAPWLYAVARNAIVDRARARTEIPAEIPDESRASPAAPTAAEQGWVAWRVHRALEELPEREREVIAARLLEWPLAERSGGVPRHPARYRQDANARGAAPPGRDPRRRRWMSEFNDLVDTEGLYAGGGGAAAARARAARPGRAAARSAARARAAPDPTERARAEIVQFPLLPRRRWAVAAVAAAAVAAARVRRRLPDRRTRSDQLAFAHQPRRADAGGTERSRSCASRSATRPATGRWSSR